MSSAFSFRPPETARRFTTECGFETGPIPIAGMSDPAYFEREVEQIWKRFWLYAGKTHHIPAPGDYFVRDFPFAGISVLVARGKDGEIRAFHNVCSHRCNKVVWDERGSARTLRCPFHGWVYGLDGSLLGVSDEGMFFDLDKQQLALTPVHVGVWEGFILVNLCPEPQPPMTLPEYLGEFHDGLRGYPFEQHTQEFVWRVRLNCNWKVLRDAFVEVYHVAFLHAQTAAASFTSDEMPYTRALSLRLTEYHGQISMAANNEMVPSPMDALAYKLGGAAVNQVGDRGEVPQSLNPARATNWAGDLNCFFPGFGVPTFPGVNIVNVFVPIDATHSIYELHLCFPPPENATQRWTQEVSQSKFHAGVCEDIKTLEHTQQVLESGAKQHYHLSDQELLVRQSHELVQKICGPYPGLPGRPR